MENIVILLGITSILFIPVLAIVVVYFIGLWKLFKKCGYEGWEALIPFYNSWILIKISGLNWWYYLMLMANVIVGVLSLGTLAWIGQIASLVASFFMYYNICKKFHKDMGFTVLTFFFTFVMIPILGFKNENMYDSSVVVSPNGPINDNSFSSDNASSSYGANSFCRYCGNKLEVNSNFCNKCGNKVNEN